jgi:hypothetical protein
VLNILVAIVFTRCSTVTVETKLISVQYQVQTKLCRNQSVVLPSDSHGNLGVTSRTYEILS